MLSVTKHLNTQLKFKLLQLVSVTGLILGFLWIGGCQSKPVNSENSVASHNLDPIIVRVTGYGAYASDKDRLSETKRLLAMRSSKLDAYRSLAERVYGTVIVGNSTVRDFVLKDDSFHTAVDAVIRGAKVVSILDNKKGSFETVVELQLDAKFRDCLTQVNQFKYNSNCLIPLANSNDLDGTFQAKSNTYSGKSSSSSLYYLK